MKLSQRNNPLFMGDSFLNLGDSEPTQAKVPCQLVVKKKVHLSF